MAERQEAEAALASKMRQPLTERAESADESSSSHELSSQSSSKSLMQRQDSQSPIPGEVSEASHTHILTLHNQTKRLTMIPEALPIFSRPT